MGALADGDLRFELTQVVSTRALFALVLTTFARFFLAPDPGVTTDEPRRKRRRASFVGERLWYCSLPTTRIPGVMAYRFFDDSRPRRDDDGASEA